MKEIKLFSTLSLLLFTTTLFAKEFNSGTTRVNLVELYTSESCSSCPPAEKWLGNLKDSRGLFKKFIPLEFHVSYWNYLHWKDPFSKEEFSKRQRDYNRVIKAGVYTPQVIFNGVDFRGWRGVSDKALSSSSGEVGNLKVDLNDKSLAANLTFSSKSTAPLGLKCFGAIVDGGHVTKVTSGENRGKTLSHQFIVQSLKSSFMTKKSGQYSCELSLDKNKIHAKSAVSFWVANQKNYKIIQATGGYIKK